MNTILRGSRPSPALIVGVIAVVLAIGGTATAALSGKDKKKVTAIADREIASQAGPIADQRITARAPGLSVASAANAANATNAKSADNAANAEKLGGVAAGGYEKGTGHTFNGIAAGAPGSTNTVLDVPGFGQLLFDCGVTGVPQPKLHNSSGATLAAIGSTHIGAATAEEPLTGAFNNGDTLTMSARTNGQSTVQLWNLDAQKETTITFSNFGCSFAASAITLG